jgi:hypothetical protein
MYMEFNLDHRYSYECTGPDYFPDGSTNEKIDCYGGPVQCDCIPEMTELMQRTNEPAAGGLSTLVVDRGRDEWHRGRWSIRGVPYFFQRRSRAPPKAWPAAAAEAPGPVAGHWLVAVPRPSRPSWLMRLARLLRLRRRMCRPYYA